MIALALALAQSGDGPWALRADRVFLAGEGRVISPGVVVVQGDRIVSAGPTAMPSLGNIVDLGDVTILPGLFDLHVHLGASGGAMVYPAEFSDEFFDRQLGAYLWWGVTSVLSLADHTSMLLAVRRETRVAPRILLAGPAFTAPGGHPVWMFEAYPELLAEATRQVDDPEAARQEVRALADRGVDVIKVVLEPGWPDHELPRLDPACLAAIVEEARARGLPVVAHVGTAEDAREAVAAGVAAITHVPREDPGALDVPLIPTLAVAQAMAHAGDADWINAIAEAPWRGGIARLAVESARSPLAWYRVASEGERERWDGTRGRMREWLARGGRIASGSDAGNLLTFHGWAAIREVELLVECGATPAQALQAATVEAARLVGRAGELGDLVAGAKADLVVVRGDPLVRIGDLYQVERVLLDGRWVDRAALSFAAEYEIPRAVPASGPFATFDAGRVRTEGGGHAWAFTDALYGGGSRAVVFGRGQHARFAGEIAEEAGFQAFASVYLYPSAVGFQVVNATGWTGLRVRLRATRRVRVLVGTEAVADFDDFGLWVEPGPEWREYDVPFARLRQGGWGREVSFDASRITLVGFSVGLPAGEFQVDVDDIRFVR